VFDARRQQFLALLQRHARSSRRCTRRPHRRREAVWQARDLRARRRTTRSERFLGRFAGYDRFFAQPLTKRTSIESLPTTIWSGVSRAAASRGRDLPPFTGGAAYRRLPKAREAALGAIEP